MRRRWPCLGSQRAHPVDLEFVEKVRQTGMTELAIDRCRSCGQLYLHERFEVSDWSAGNDYSDTTYTWTALDADEIAAVRQDPNYPPRSGRAHREGTGWRSA